MVESLQLEPVQAWPALSVQAVYRACPQDFRVHEDLQLDAEGGEHLWLEVEKTGQNTVWVARQLAAWAGIDEQHVGWSGLKDRQAVTRQWFSLYLPGRESPDLSSLDVDGVKLLRVLRQAHKLKPGMHTGNRFVLVLRRVSGDIPALETRLRWLAEQGFANSFGPQRFGHGQGNLLRLQERLQQGRLPRRDGRMISTARAFLFNRQLQMALQGEDWQQQPLWLWGRFHRDVRLNDLHERVREDYSQLCNWLERLNMNAVQRATCVHPRQLRHQWLHTDVLQLEFSLPPGSFATSLLAELGDVRASEDGTSEPDLSPHRQW